MTGDTCCVIDCFNVVDVECDDDSIEPTVCSECLEELGRLFEIAGEKKYRLEVANAELALAVALEAMRTIGDRLHDHSSIDEDCCGYMVDWSAIRAALSSLRSAPGGTEGERDG